MKYTSKKVSLLIKLINNKKQCLVENNTITLSRRNLNFNEFRLNDIT